MLSYEQKRFFIALFFFFLVIFLLGIPFTQWWFHGADDFHALWLAHKTKIWKQLLYFFYEGHTNQGQTGPSNFIVPAGRTGFLETFYRPLYHIFHTLQYWAFGTNGYPYFFISVTIHAVNTALLFLLFSLFVPLLPASIGSLMFAFHPQIAFRFGQLVNQHYYVSTCFLLLCLLTYRQYILCKKVRFILLSTLLYVLALFTRESTLLFSGAVFLLTFALHKKQTVITQFTYALKKTAPLLCASISFLLLRLLLYPWQVDTHTTLHTSFASKLLKKIPELKVFLYDFFALSWLPWGHPLLRGSILIFMLVMLVFFFIKNKYKLIILTLFCCSTLMLWPSLPGHYNPRYFYESYGFILAAQLLLMHGVRLHIPHIFKQITAFLFCLSVSMQGLFCFYNFSVHETKYGTFHNAIEKLLYTPGINRRPLVFLGHPAEGFGDHFAQFFWTMFDNKNHPVYFDRTTALVQADAHILKSSKYALHAAPLNKRNYFSVTPVHDGFRFTTHNPNKINFADLTDNGYSLGEKIVHKKELINGSTVVTDFTLQINKKYLKNNPIFVRWDYKKQWFIMLSHQLSD